MDISGSKIVILGGAGLIGAAISRKLLQGHSPSKLIITALTKEEVDKGIEELKKYSKDTKIAGHYGNIFVRSDFKDMPRGEIFENAEIRRQFVLDTLAPLDDNIYQASSLFQLLQKEKPDIIIDCINTATALAYQDVFETSRTMLEFANNFSTSNTKEQVLKDTEILIGTQYTPQLIRHIQILWKALVDNNVKSYLKVGTTGTGGMGLNIPYTHSEDKPSRVLLAKSAVAGAHSMLLFLLGRTATEHSTGHTPDRNIKSPPPLIKEVKPAAAVAWKGIDFGEVKSKGKPIELYDHNVNEALDSKSILEPSQMPWKSLGKNLKAPYIDTGENGIFSRGEFEAITDEGQMEFITPEEIAEAVETEILGGNSRADIVTALDTAILGPTYRAGILRSRAISELKRLEKENGISSVAFENLGPPRLSKLLYELYLITREHKLLDDVGISAEKLAQRCEKRILENQTLRTYILSIGIPIILNNGKVLRGPTMVVPSKWDYPKDGIVDEKYLNLYANQGWLDLRTENFRKWQKRLKALRHEASDPDKEHSGSVHVRNRTYWEDVQDDESLGSVAGWIFLREENGERLKR